ncbi:MAG: selenoprotein O, partial [bacterium]|nr:selenoprotein O [bacterium]
FRRRLADFEPERPERLAHPVFGRDEPEELLVEEVEALWAPIATTDDWAPAYAKLERIEAARQAYDFGDDAGAAGQSNAV